jgi:hypothetical protein
MRLYHPDTNPDPQAQVRAREITAAFFVLGNRERRAAYDADTLAGADMWHEKPPWPPQVERGPPPMRNLGLAAVAVAVAMSVSVAMWPTGEAPESASRPKSAVPVQSAEPANPAPALELPAMPVATADRIPDQPVPAPVEIADPVPSPSPVTLPPSSRSVKAPKPQVAPPIAKAPTQRQVASARPLRTSPGRSVASATPVAGTDRPAQVERLASGYLKQSLNHADWNKQQLLLSAQIRSRTSRKLCRSDDCVTKVYLRQMRETSAIMEGRIPER